MGMTVTRLSKVTMTLAFASGLFITGSAAWADCACFCVSGELETLCRNIEDAQDNPDLCPQMQSAACPQDYDAPAGASYEAPDNQAVNCRDVRVYDTNRDQYVTRRACDVI